MGLARFPAEIWTQIIEDLVHVADLQNLAALRRVNRLFNDQISEIFSPNGLSHSSKWARPTNMSCELFAKLAAGRCLATSPPEKLTLAWFKLLVKEYQSEESRNKEPHPTASCLEDVCRLYCQADLPGAHEILLLPQQLNVCYSLLLSEPKAPHSARTRFETSIDLLNLAVYYNDVELLVRLLQSPTASKADGWGQLGSPIFLCAKLGRLEIFDIFMRLNEVPPRSRMSEEHGDSATSAGTVYEIEDRALPRCRFMHPSDVVHGIDIRTLPRRWLSAIEIVYGTVQVAAGAGHWSIFEIWEGHLPGVFSTELLQAAILCASWAGHLELLKQALASFKPSQFISLEDSLCPLDFSLPCYRGSPLRAAAYQGHLEIVKFLLDSGASPNYAISRYHKALGEKTTPLQLATEMGHLEVAKILLAAGAV